MKKILIFILGFSLYPAVYEVLDHIQYRHKVELNLPYRFEYGFMKPFNKMCTKDVSKNGHGWVYVRREYFACGLISTTISDMLYGEYVKPRNPELEKQACKSCRM